MALRSHRGWDPGALVLARALARALDAPLVSSTTSRLLVDLNRSLHHPRLFSERVRALDAADRARILIEHYRPHRCAVWREVMGGIRRRGRALHLAVHSFVPELDGERRRADLALLYDPKRAPERELCALWVRALRARDPRLRTRRNYPYRGRADGLTTALRRRLGASRYLGIELEVSQHLSASSTGRARVLRALLPSLEDLRRGRPH